MNASYYDKFLRTSRRLKGWDYSREGYYFITICTANREMIFGEINNGQMTLNRFGEIAMTELEKTFELRDNLKPDKFIVMPNHIHIIIALQFSDAQEYQSGTVMARHDADKPSESPSNQKFGNPTPGSLSTIIGAYKSAVTKKINQLRDTLGVTIWQPRFHDRIIRSRRELHIVRHYIEQNPSKWESDKQNVNLLNIPS